MKVYVLVSEDWDETNIGGVYGSPKVAMEQVVLHIGMSWKPSAEPGCFHVEGLRYGSACRIEEHELKTE